MWGVRAWLLLCGTTVLFASERKLCILTPSYNNAAYCIRNLDSVRKQKYTNWRMMYLDDCSSDGMSELVQEYIKHHNLADKITYIRNTERRGALANYYYGIHMADPEEILLLIDGDDWLTNDHVFVRINDAYANPMTWMTYGQYQEYPTGHAGNCRAAPESIVIRNVYREYDWIFSHLRTFYAWLGQRIKLQDLLYEGKFFQVASDVALIFPLVEMAGKHCTFIPDVMYHHNVATPSNDFKNRLVEQHHFNHVVRGKKKYAALTEPVLVRYEQNKTADMIIFAHNAEHTRVLVESAFRYVIGLRTLFVVYDDADLATAEEFKVLSEHFPAATWVRTRFGVPAFAQQVQRILAEVSSPYLMFATDDMMLHQAIVMNDVAFVLERTRAHGVYYALGKDIMRNKALKRQQHQPPFELIGDHVYAWQFKYGEHDWRCAHSLNMALYRTADVRGVVQELNFVCPKTLQAAWNMMRIEEDALGLVGEVARVKWLGKEGKNYAENS